MKRLRRSVVALLIFLALFYNIERLDLGQQNIINIQGIVYFVGLVATVSVVFVPLFWHRPVVLSIAIWTGILMISKLLVSEGRPVWGGIYTYLSITETVLLAILVVLAKIVARNLLEFEEVVKNITFADVGRRVKSLDEVEDDIQVELLRSRRHHYPLTVMVIQPDRESVKAVLHRMVLEVQQAMMARYVLASLARLIGGQLRRTDIVVDQHEQGRFVIVSPDTNAAHSAALAERIKTAAAEKLGVELACGVASFPDEALTFTELVSQAESQLSKSVPMMSSLPVYTMNETKL
jgi:GGDEF domain-containing protein